MAAIAKNIYFFNCLFLIYFKLQWSEILTTATWHWVVQHIFPSSFFQQIYTDEAY
jgi:hypothetical protein